MSTVWCERHDRAVPEDRDRCFDCETELILRQAAERFIAEKTEGAG